VAAPLERDRQRHHDAVRHQGTVERREVFGRVRELQRHARAGRKTRPGAQMAAHAIRGAVNPLVGEDPVRGRDRRMLGAGARDGDEGAGEIGRFHGPRSVRPGGAAGCSGRGAGALIAL
jgi:hypothetical protein